MIPALSMPKVQRKWLMAIAIVIILSVAGIYIATKYAKDGSGTSAHAPAPTITPVLTVELTTPRLADWPQTIVANGNITAWQETIIGAEISGYQLTEVLANVGDTVKKGQLLAHVSSDVVTAELEQSKAAVAEAEAMLAEARLNADRARKMELTGALSAQQINQYLTAEKTVLARLDAAKAKLQADALRLDKTRIVAPNNGVISARAATVGSLTQPGQELFRLIRDNRLEWRAEVTAVELGRIKPGMKVSLMLPNGASIKGEVRMIGPTVDIQTRTAIIYVNLPDNNAARAGMFARGEFELGQGTALTLPQSAVLIRDGLSYVYRADASNRVMQHKVMLGRRLGDRVEIASGLDKNIRVVTSGVGFLANGDVVRVVNTP